MRIWAYVYQKMGRIIREVHKWAPILTLSKLLEFEHQIIVLE